MFCHICNNEMVSITDTINGIVCEDLDQCKRCGFTYEYQYGYTRIEYGYLFSIIYCYTDSADEAKRALDLKKKYDFWYKILWRINPLFYFLSE